MSIAFKVSHTLDSGRVILKDLCGRFPCGSLTAVIGASGSGKTTFLDVLSGRKSSGVTQGFVSFEPSPNTELVPLPPYDISYVLQDTLFHQQLTVLESVQFAAELQRGDLSRDECAALARDAVEVMGLGAVADQRIGGELVRGVSGGEAKRVAVARALVAQPKLLLLDEPTSGLDSSAALALGRTLKSLAKDRQVCVVCSIHQPRSDLFLLFDHVAVISGGSLLFHGETRRAFEFFTDASIGFSPPDPSVLNPADHIMDMAVALNLGSTIAGDKKLLLLEDVAAAAAAVRPAALRPSSAGQAAATSAPMLGDTSKQLPALHQTAILVRRQAKVFWRTRLTTVVALAQAVFQALLMISIFHGLGHAQADIQNRIGFFFFFIMSNVFSNMGSIPGFIEDRAIFQRERGAGIVGVVPYFFAKVIVELPTQLILPLIVSSAVYFVVGLQHSAQKFLWFTGTVVLTGQCGSAFVVLIAAISKTMQAANGVAPALLVLFVLFAGFYLNAASIPIYFRWVREISFIRYGFEALVSNEFTGLTFKCSPGLPCVTTGDQELVLLGFANVSLPQHLSIMASIAVVLRILSVAALALFNREKR